MKQEQCLDAAGIPSGGFAMLSLGSTRPQWQLGVPVIADILPLLCLGPHCTAGDGDGAGGSGHLLSLSVQGGLWGSSEPLHPQAVSWARPALCSTDTVGGSS